MSTGSLEPKISKKFAVLGAMQQGRQTAQIRVGFFAGVFDPIHDGHVEVAKSALRELELNTVYFMVEEKPWGDKNPAKLVDRRNMVELAVEPETNIMQLKLSDNQFTISDTLKSLELKFVDSELYFILGADVFMQMDEQQWPHLDELLKHYIVVFERKNITQKEITQKAKDLGIVVAILPSQHLHHSSTDIRLQSHRKSLWVPKKVSEYIEKNQLYSVSDSKLE